MLLQPSEESVTAEHTISMLDLEFWYYSLLFSVIALWIYFGLQFFLKGVREQENKAQRTYQMGFGVFITLAVALEGLYVISVFLSDYYDINLFRTEGDYGIQSIVYEDFFVLTPAVMFASLAFLLYPIEKFMLKKDHPTFSILNLIIIPFPFIVRFIEANIEGWTGMELDGSSIAWFGVTIAWGFLFIIAFLSVFLVMALYARMAKAAPAGSKLKRKAWFVNVGLLLWATGLFSTGESHSRIWYWHVPDWSVLGMIWFFWTPVLLLISLVLLTSGFSREF